MPANSTHSFEMRVEYRSILMLDSVKGFAWSYAKTVSYSLKPGIQTPVGHTSNTHKDLMTEWAPTLLHYNEYLILLVRIPNILIRKASFSLIRKESSVPAVTTYAFLLYTYESSGLPHLARYHQVHLSTPYRNVSQLFNSLLIWYSILMLSLQENFIINASNVTS